MVAADVEKDRFDPDEGLTQPSGFKLTLDKYCEGVLTHEERVFYEEQGYILKKGVIPKDLIDKINARFLEYATGERPLLHPMGLMRDIGLVRAVKAGKLPKETLKSDLGVYKINFAGGDDVFFSWVSHPENTKNVRAFAGPDQKTFANMYINKPPDVGGSGVHPIHQDMVYYPWTHGERTVGSWTALAPVTKDNGCLVVVPGSHKRGLLDHSIPDWIQNAGFHTVTEVADVSDLDDVEHARINLVRVEMEPGDTLYFSPYLLHGSGLNKTGSPRKSIVAHYANAKSKYYKVFEPPQDFAALNLAKSAHSKSGHMERDAEANIQEARDLTVTSWKRQAQLAAGIDWRAETGDGDYL